MELHVLLPTLEVTILNATEPHNLPMNDNGKMGVALGNDSEVCIHPAKTCKCFRAFFLVEIANVLDDKNALLYYTDCIIMVTSLLQPGIIERNQVSLI